MIAVTTPTGQIGSRLVDDLLAAGQPVRVIVRDPAKLAPAVRGRVEVVQGSTDDAAALGRLCDGAESLFWLTPPPTSGNVVAGEYYAGFHDAVAAAITGQGVRRVVAVSALGHGSGMDAGLVSQTLATDAAIEATGVDFRALWCPGFMDNVLRSIPTLQHQGAFYGMLPADLKLPYVATRDIAAMAAKLLLDPSWRGQGGVGVLGPEDVSQNDQAAILTDVLGKPIRYQVVPGDAYKAQLMQYGASESVAQGLVTMFEAKSRGLDNQETRTAGNTTPTTFRQWCEQVLVPAMAG